jgi:hypothetical protein
VDANSFTLRDWCAENNVDPRRARAHARDHKDELQKLETSKYVYPKGNKTKLHAIMKEVIAA